MARENRTMMVKAADGKTVPRQDRPQERIPTDKFIQVPWNSYYRQMWADGALVCENVRPRGEKQKTAEAKPAGKEKSK